MMQNNFTRLNLKITMILLPKRRYCHNCYCNSTILTMGRRTSMTPLIKKNSSYFLSRSQLYLQVVLHGTHGYARWACGRSGNWTLWCTNFSFSGSDEVCGDYIQHQLRLDCMICRIQRTALSISSHIIENVSNRLQQTGHCRRFSQFSFRNLEI